MIRRLPLAATLVLTLWSVSARADTSIEQPHVMLGRCELRLDPATAAGKEELGFLVCIKGAVGVEVTSVSGTPDENSWMKYAHLAGGLFVTEWVSLQARGRFRDREPLGDLVTEDRDLETEYVVVQVGNPALHPVRLTAGRIRLPFGIDRTGATEQYQAFENRTFWDSPPHGGYVTIDNLRATTLEIGAATNALVDRKDPEKSSATVDAAGEIVEEPLVQAASVRIMTDFAALDGSRVLLSGYGESSGVRRMGAGFLTVSAKDDITLFEFVRRMATPDGSSGNFDQLLRIGYTGTWRDDTRWVVQFDDERHRFRRGMLGHDARVYDHFTLRLAVSYHKSETGDGQRRWYVTSGLEARL